MTTRPGFSRTPSNRPQGTLEARLAGAGMKVPFLAVLVLLAAPPCLLSAQETIRDRPLTETQQLGQRLFYRECAVCHAPPLITSTTYAAVLYKGVIEGQEEAARGITRRGLPAQMPGFEYGLKPAEIDAIIEYLKTVPKPSVSTQTGESDKRAD